MPHQKQPHPTAHALRNVFARVMALNDAEIQFVEGMVPHHQAAIEMAQAVLADAENPTVIDLAEGIIGAQAGEIALIGTWLDEQGDTSAAAKKKKKPMKPMKMQGEDGVNAKARLRGIVARAMPLNDAEIQFLEGMVPHHQMAIEMAKAVLVDAENPTIIALAEGIIGAQAGEIELINTWLEEAGATSAAPKKMAPMQMHAGGATNAHSKALAQPQMQGRIELMAKGIAQSDLYIYGDIGDSWYGDSVTAKGVVDQLNTLDAAVKTINVYINSYGGSVTDGLAIHNALKRKAREGVAVLVNVDGIAASIASLIAMAGDTVNMADNTMMMVHAPWGGLYVTGNAEDVRKASTEFADVLDIYAKAMANSYASKTGKPYADMLALVTDGVDHWYTAAEAKAAGLCDAILEAANDAAALPAADTAARLAAEPAFAKYFRGMPTQIAAALRHPTRAAHAAKNTPAAAGATPPALPGNQGDTMKTEEQKAAEAKAAAEARSAAIAGLQARNIAITDLAKAHMGNADVRAYVDGVIAAANPDVCEADVGKHILALLAKDRGPLGGGGHVIAGADERDKTRLAMASAIEVRAYGGKSGGDNPYRGMTMFEMARASADRAGVNTRGMDRMDVVGAAFTHSNSDFPLLLSNTASKALKKGYEEAPEVFPMLTRAVSLSDFKPTTLAGLGLFGDLDVVREGGEYKYGTFSETGSPLRLVTYGKMFSVTRQAIINDDLNSLSDVPRKLGQAAKRTIGNAVFNLLISNPTMADGFALFSTEHGNLVSPGSVISTASVDGIRVLLATQNDTEGLRVRVPLKYIVVPVGLGGLARTVLESQFEVGGSKNLSTPNSVRNSFEVIEDPRLDAASATAWYGIADPALFDGLILGYLDGNQEPYLEAKEGWSVDGTAWKVRIDAAAAVADPIALAKNPGA